MFKQKSSWAALIIGMLSVAYIVFAIGLIGQPDRTYLPNAVTCNGQVMHQGDDCEITRGGITDHKSYHDMYAAETEHQTSTGPIVASIISGVIALFCFYVLFRRWKLSGR
jgi:hypothetical protein